MSESGAGRAAKLRPGGFRGVMALAWCLAAAQTAAAGPIRHREHAGSAGHPAVRAGSFSAFLAGGQAVWETTAAPRIPSHLHVASVGGLLPDSALVEYLTWRRSLDPARFDRCHPCIGPKLAKSEALRSQQALTVPAPTAPAPVAATSCPSLPASPSPQLISPPPAVPEPTTWAGSILLLAAGMLWMLGEARRATA